MARKLFGDRIEPACAWCGRGRPTRDGGSILCEKAGVCAPYSHCRHYRYDPLRRVPTPPQVLPKYEDRDFCLDLPKEG